MIVSVSEGFPTELFNYPIEGATNDPTAPLTPHGTK